MKARHLLHAGGRAGPREPRSRTGEHVDHVNARAWAAAHLATHLWQTHRPESSRSRESWRPAVELLRPGLALPAGVSSLDLTIRVDVPEIEELDVRRRILLLRREDFHVWRAGLTEQQRLAWCAFLAKPKRALVYLPTRITSKGRTYTYLRRAPRADPDLADALRKLPSSVYVLLRARQRQQGTKPARPSPVSLVASHQ